MKKARAFGMRFVPKIVRAAARAAAAGAVFAAGAADAQSLCAGLRQAMAAADAGFAALAIPGERAAAGAVAARTLLPWAQRCEVRADSRAVEYRCRMTDADAASSEARVAFRQSVAGIRECFSGLRPRGDGDYTGAKEWTGAVIWEPRPGLRVAAVFFAQEEFALVADRDDGDAERLNVSWIVVDKRR